MGPNHPQMQSVHLHNIVNSMVCVLVHLQLSLMGQMAQLQFFQVIFKPNFLDTIARQQIVIESSPDLGICSTTRGQDNDATLVHF